MDIVLLYITAPNKAEAEALAAPLLAERLIACANILPEITSIYEWEGKNETTTETVLLLKTRASLQEAVMKRVEELHPYDCPCIMVLPINAAHPPFAEWIFSQTKD
ncbi:MAG: divalent-cation tolerance protein CutA [Rickettsiales bacterium]